jgi:predicted RNase H-like HicB family nuclease
MDSDFHYPIQIVWSREDDAYLAFTPLLHGCVADGATPAEALENLEPLIAEWLEAAKDHGWPIPRRLSLEDITKEFEQAVAAHQRAVQQAAQVAEVQFVELLARTAARPEVFPRGRTLDPRGVFPMLSDRSSK